MSLNRHIQARFDLPSDIGCSIPENTTVTSILTRRSHRAFNADAVPDDLLATLTETLRIMRVGGRLIILQPNFKYCYKTYFDDYTHLQIFTAEGMYDLLEMAGLRVVDSHPRFLPVNMKSTLKLKLPLLWLLVRAYLPLPYKPLAAQMLVIAEKPAPRDG